MQETWVQTLGQEDPLEKRMATHSSILVWRIPWTEEPGGLQSIVSYRVRYDSEHARQVEIRMIGWSQYLPEMFPVVINMFDESHL